MKLEEVAKKLGYSDVEHLKRNIEGYGSPLDRWWEVIEELVNELDLHFVRHCKPQEMPTIKVKEITGYSISQTNAVNEFCENHNVISVTPQITTGNNKYLVVYYA